MSDRCSIKVGPVSVSLKCDGDRVVYHEMHDRTGFEPHSLEAWSQMVQPGFIALDVGAYTGLYAIAAAKLGASAVAIEPIAANAKRLRENAERNHVQVMVIESAVSNVDGKALMFARGSGGLPSGGKIARTSKGHSWGEVDVIKLDDLQLVGVRAVKMDVERHEPKALRGGAHLFAHQHPALLIEALGDGERLAIECALPGYCVDEVLDRRNLLMTVKRK